MISTRAQVVTRRTYNRPLNTEGTVFETWKETVDRVIGHQRFLWSRAKTANVLEGMPLHDVTEDLKEWVNLSTEEENELEELRLLLMDRKVAVAGRCFTGDTKVKLLDGTTPRFDELEVGKKYWTYGATMEGEIVPVEAINNGITRVDNTYAKITLDNGETISCTVDHPFLTRDGTYIEAQYLVSGQSLMPLYTRLNRHGYQEVKNNYTGKWIATHKLVAEDTKLPIPTFSEDQFLIIHHKDFNKYNNIPSNLEYMGDKDHFKIHSDLGKENAKKMNDLIWHHPDYENFRKNKAKQCREMALDFWDNPKYLEARKVVAQKSSERASIRNKTDSQKQAMKEFRDTEQGKKISLVNLQKANEGFRGIKVKLLKIAQHLNSLNIELTETNWNANKPYKTAMKFHNITKYFESLDKFKQELLTYNHTVVNVEIIVSENSINFYDFSVPRTVNFALASGVFVHNTLWLGGTDIAKRREASMFNCSFTNVETVWDAVDVFWLLLQGCGVGFRPVAGSLTGFRNFIPELKIIRSNNSTNKGREENEEDWDPINKTWTLSVGDSAEAWAKSIGKLLAGKYNAKRLVLDFSNIRKPGIRLKNYGWLSQGDIGLTTAYTKIYEILNAKADSLLSEIDILDIINLLGTVLSTRRSAQIAVMDDYNPIVEEFAEAKSGLWENGKSHRSQSNNSIIFWKRPTKEELLNWFEKINLGGNGEPGMINGEQMKARAPWAIGLNPCAEILLPNKGFCNLVSIDLLKFKGNNLGLLQSAKIIARANYRQTVVDFRDGILQEAWHLNNEHLRLCGVSLMGIAGRTDMHSYEYRKLERVISEAANQMAEELGMPMPKNTTA